MDGLEMGRMIRKAYGIKTPMNVWKRQFTERPNWLECAALALKLAPSFDSFESKFRIGDTITIKRPARYVNAIAP